MQNFQAKDASYVRYHLHMMDERVFVGDKPMNVYTSAQVRDVLEEAHRLECVMRLGGALMGVAVRKLDSLNSGRMDG